MWLLSRLKSLRTSSVKVFNPWLLISHVFIVSLTIILPLAAQTEPAKIEPLSLKAAAQKMAQHLPAGCIVTAEFKNQATDSAVAGAPHGDFPPDKLLFEIGSISKVFTSLLLAQAVIEKRVTLDTSLKQLLPEHNYTSPEVANITLRQLATHTSGLPRLPGILSLGAEQLNPYAHFDRATLDTALVHTIIPDSGPHPWSYSNYGAGLLGDLLSRTYEKPWPELVQEKICIPLGLIDTTVSLSPDQQKRFTLPHHDSEKVKPWTFQALAGAGALRSTAADLITFGQALLNPENTPLADAITLMIKERSEDGKHGLGIAHYLSLGQATMGHNGGTGGFVSSFEVFPKTNTIKVILINNILVNPSDILKMTRGIPTPYDQAPAQKTPPPTELIPYLGSYQLTPSLKFTITATDGHLMAKLTGQPSLPVEQKRKDWFEYRAVKAALEFERDQNDKIIALKLHQNGLIQRAPKNQ